MEAYEEMILLKVNRQEVSDPELVLKIVAMRSCVDKAANLVNSVKPIEDVPRMFQVKSSKTNEVYLVDLRGSNGPTCCCMDYTIRDVLSGIPCKHILAARLKQDRIQSEIQHDYGAVY